MKSFKFPRLMIPALFPFLPMLLHGCAEPGVTTYAELTVTVDGSGKVNPDSASVPRGKQVTLQAIPTTGWRFDHWEGPVTGSTNPITFTLNSDVTVKAVFVSGSTHQTPEAYNLTVTTPVGDPVSFSLVGYSPDTDQLTYTPTWPLHGDLGGSPPLVTYIPKPGFTGLDSFTYTAKDAYGESPSAKVNIEVVAAAPTGWARTFGSTDVDRIYAITYDSVGNVYITGKFSGTVDFDPGKKNALYASAGKTDAFLAKYSPSGEFIWVKTIGGADNDTGTSLAADLSNNIYITGTFSGTIAIDAKSGTYLTNKNGTGVFVCQFNSSGEFGWAKPITGNGSALSYTIGLDGSGNVFVGGSFKGQVDFNSVDGTDKITSHGLIDGFVTKLTTAGKYIWTDVFGGAADDEVTALGLEGSGNIYITGYFASLMDINPGTDVENISALGAADVFLVKLNTNGQKIWSKVIGGPGKDIPYALAVNDTGDVVIGGVFEQNFDFDPERSGDIHTSLGKADGFVTRISSNGLYQWTRTFGGIGDDIVNGVAFDATNNVYVDGGFTGEVNFQRSFGGADLITSAGMSDAFAARMNGAGEYGATVTVGGPKEDVAYAISFNRLSLTLFWGGSFQDTADLDPRKTKIENHNAFGNDDCFLIRTTPEFDW